MTDDELLFLRALTLSRATADGDKLRQRDMTAPVAVVQIPLSFPAGYTGCGCTTPQACWRHR